MCHAAEDYEHGLLEVAAPALSTLRVDDPREGVLVAWGYTTDGERVLLDVCPGARERRGLAGPGSGPHPPGEPDLSETSRGTMPASIDGGSVAIMRMVVSLLMIVLATTPSCAVAQDPASSGPAVRQDPGTPESAVGPRPAPAMPDRRQPDVYLVPRGIASDGTGDATNALQSWLDMLPAHSIAVFDRSTTREGWTAGTDAAHVVYRLTRFLRNSTNPSLFGATALSCSSTVLAKMCGAGESTSQVRLPRGPGSLASKSVVTATMALHAGLGRATRVKSRLGSRSSAGLGTSR